MQIIITPPDLDNEARRLQALGASPSSILAAGGKTLETGLRDHFQARNEEPNKRGWPKRNFWNRIRGSTALESLTDNEAVVAVSDPAINQKVYGGTITPKRGKYLAIPARAEAYAAGSPREANVDKLEVLYGRHGPWALAERMRTDIAWKRKSMRQKGWSDKGQGERYRDVAASRTVGGGVWYFLVKSVTQQPDPNALPDETTLSLLVFTTFQTAFNDRIELLKAQSR